MQLQNGDALLGVDLLNDFVTGSLKVEGAVEIIPAVVTIVDRFVEQGKPVFLSACWHPEDHCSFKAQGGPWPVHGVARTWGSEFVAPLQERAMNGRYGITIILKGQANDDYGYSSFAGTGLHEALQAAKVSRLFVCGIATNFCVLATVLDALALGYTVVLLGDAIVGVKGVEPDISAALQKMYSAGALARDTKWVKAA